MPDGPSAQEKLTVTSELFQPFAFAAGDRLLVIVGADLSSFTVISPVPTLPSRSAAVVVFVTPAVFALTESDAGVGPDPTPEPASVALQVIVTLALFQPAAVGRRRQRAGHDGPGVVELVGSGARPRCACAIALC